MRPTGYRVWECKIVVRDDVELPDGFDFPPRRAAIDAVTDRGISVVSCFSGLGGELRTSERNLLSRDKFDYPATGERLAMKVDTRKLTAPLASLSERLAALKAKVLDTNHDAPPGARVSDRQCASPADTGVNTAGRDMGNGVFVASTAKVLAMHEETVAKLTAESEQLAHERDIYISNELSALRSWQKALTERDEARRDRDALLESEAWGVNCKPSPAAPQAAANWLTAEERRVLNRVSEHLFETSQLHFTDIVTLDALLAREMPPEVVRPGKPLAFRYGDDAIANRDGQWREALATAGVAGQGCGTMDCGRSG